MDTGDAFGECSEKDLHLSPVFGVSKARTGGAFLLRRVPFGGCSIVWKLLTCDIYQKGIRFIYIRFCVGMNLTVKFLAIGQARFVSIEIKHNHKRFSPFFSSLNCQYFNLNWLN